MTLQGTGRTYRPDHRELALSVYSSGMHDVWEQKVRHSGTVGSQPEGVAIMAPRGLRRIQKEVWTPTDRALEGRGLAVRFSDGDFDLMVVSIYCPVNTRDKTKQRLTEKLWIWVRQLRTYLKGRTRMIIGTDSNGHVGSVREWTRDIEDRRGGGTAAAGPGEGGGAEGGSDGRRYA